MAIAAPALGSISRVPLFWVLLVTISMGIVFSTVPWPYGDLVMLMTRAASFTWPEAVADAFSDSIEFRPLMLLFVKLSYEVAGLTLWYYKGLVLLQFALILGLLVLVFRPRRALTAVVALSCIVGLHTSRALFVFVPVNAYGMGLILLLVCMIAALDPRTRDRDWVFFPLVLVALLMLETGVLIAAAVVVLWVTKAPGVGARGMIATLAALGAYFAIRLTLAPLAGMPESPESGLGFVDVPAAELDRIFTNAPWLFWLYNVGASVLTVVLSEPRSGKFKFIETLLKGNTPVWQWLHVLSSMASTAVILWALSQWRGFAARDRQVAAVGGVLFVIGSGLGFLYTRDRIALAAGIGYGMLLYVSLSWLLARAAPSRLGRVAATAFVVIVGAAWTLRTVEAHFHIRDTAWENHVDWNGRSAPEASGMTESEADILKLWRWAESRRPPDDPRRDPLWTYTLFEREYNRAEDQ